jgi:hypothetical protein
MKVAIQSQLHCDLLEVNVPIDTAPCSHRHCTMFPSRLHHVPIEVAPCSHRGCTMFPSRLHYVPIEVAPCSHRGCTMFPSRLHHVPIEVTPCSHRGCTICHRGGIIISFKALTSAYDGSAHVQALHTLGWKPLILLGIHQWL